MQAPVDLRSDKEGAGCGGGRDRGAEPYSQDETHRESSFTTAPVASNSIEQMGLGGAEERERGKKRMGVVGQYATEVKRT